MATYQFGRGGESDDLEEVVRGLWRSFDELFESYNQAQMAKGTRILTLRAVAEDAGVCASTFLGWRRDRRIPKDYSGIVRAAKRLGGDGEKWQRECLEAWKAHERLLEIRRSDPRSVEGVPAHQPPQVAAEADLPDRPTEPPESAPVAKRRWIARVFRGLAVRSKVVVILTVAVLLAAVSSAAGWAYLHLRRAADPRGQGSQGRDIVCAKVTAKSAAVYSEPDTAAEVVKWKTRNKPIEILPEYAAPAGWYAVDTPGDEPGFNWMRADTLNQPVHSSQPCAELKMTVGSQSAAASRDSAAVVRA